MDLLMKLSPSVVKHESEASKLVIRKRPINLVGAVTVVVMTLKGSVRPRCRSIANEVWQDKAVRVLRDPINPNFVV